MSATSGAGNASLPWRGNRFPTPRGSDERIKAVALRAPAARVRETGRLLVRYGTEPTPVAVGLALLTEVATARDIP